MLEYKASKEGALLITAYQAFVEKHTALIDMPLFSEGLRLVTHQLETLVNGLEDPADSSALIKQIMNEEISTEEILALVEGRALRKAEEKAVKLKSLLTAETSPLVQFSVMAKGPEKSLADAQKKVKEAVTALRQVFLKDRAYFSGHLRVYLSPTKTEAALDVLVPKISQILETHLCVIAARIDLAIETLAKKESSKETSVAPRGD